jgi:hypothetical protein
VRSPRWSFQSLLNNYMSAAYRLIQILGVLYDL